VAWQVMVCLFGHVIVPRLPSKWTLQPAWVKGVTPIRLVPNEGKMCTVLACGGMPGSGSSAVWVEVITSWLATCTVMGFAVGRVLGRLELAEK
jgi:hypothetical protein